MTRYYETEGGGWLPVEEQKCKAVIWNGKQCTRNHELLSDYCWQHDHHTKRLASLLEGDYAQSMQQYEEAAQERDEALEQEREQIAYPSPFADKLARLVEEVRSVEQENALLRATLAEVQAYVKGIELE